MPMDAETRREIEGLKSIIRELRAGQQRQAAAARTPQLGHSSIDDGALEVRDPESGATRVRIGWQPDGRPGLSFEGGDPSPAPSTPVVAPAPVGLMAQWDGQMADPDTDLPSDLDHVSVHVSDTSGVTPSQATFQGTIPRAGGLFPIVPLEVGTTYYVVFVPVGTGGVEGEPSAEASGVPEGVGGVPGPGSITETEIADDAISTPKLQALAVTAAKVAANTIEAGHITAGAVTAAKLAAEIVLATRVIAGNPGADRAEIDSDGIKVYDADDALILTTEGGNLTLTGAIVGSHIDGSTLALTLPSGTLTIDEDAFSRPAVTLRRASPATSSLTLAPGSMYLESVHDSSSYPYLRQVATDTYVESFYQAPGAGAVRIFSEERSALWLYAPMGGLSGAMSASNRPGTDAPLLGIASPSHAPSGGGVRQYAVVELEGSTAAQPGSRALYYGDQHVFARGGGAVAPDGVVSVDPALSVVSDRHAPVRGDLVSSPGSFSTGADFYDFASGDFAPFTFKTGWSGRVRITVMMSGLNAASAVSSIALGFRLSGAGTLAGSLRRAAFVRSIGAGTGSSRQSCQVVYLNLNANATYTLTPCYRITSGTVAFYDTSLDNSITVEPLM